MSARLIAGLALALLAVAGTVSTAEEAASPGGAGVRVPPAPVDSDLLRIRNIFRFADNPVLDTGGPPAAGRVPDAVGSEDAPAAPPRARLVGLVERGGRLVAALVLDGEVVLLAEGQSVGGFTAIGVSEEAVHLRTPEGDERVLLLPQ